MLDAGTAGFGFFIFALGIGVAVGVVLLSVFQRHIPKARVFAASRVRRGRVADRRRVHVRRSSSRRCSSAIMGVCAGSVYVLGFTLLHENVDDELRGRIFSALYTLVRFCVLIAFAVGPFLSDLLDRLSEDLVGGSITVGGHHDRRARRAAHAVARRAHHHGRRRAGGDVAAGLAGTTTSPAACPIARDELLLQEGAELVSGLTDPVHRGEAQPRAPGARADPSPRRPPPEPDDDA